MDYTGFFIYMFIGAFTPGPNNLMALFLGARYGLQGARKFIIGSMASVLVKMVLCGLLNLALASVIPGLVPYLKWLGAAYMVYLGVHIVASGIRESRAAQGAAGEAEAPQDKTGGSTYRDGVLLQLLNIKSYVYALSIFSIYVVPHTRRMGDILLWSFVSTLVLLAATLCWTFFGTAIKRIYAKYRLPCDLVMCASLFYCAVTAVLP